MKNAFVVIINLLCVFGVPITKLSNLISYYHAPVQMQYLNLLPCSYCPSAACLKLKYCSSEAFLITSVNGSTQTNIVFLNLLPFCISQTLKPLYLTVLSCCVSLSPPYPPSHSSTMNPTGIKKVLGKFKFLGIENSEFVHNLKLISYLLWYSWFLSSPLFNFFFNRNIFLDWS